MIDPTIVIRTDRDRRDYQEIRAEFCDVLGESPAYERLEWVRFPRRMALLAALDRRNRRNWEPTPFEMSFAETLVKAFRSEGRNVKWIRF